jgi:hypothetical protein
MTSNLDENLHAFLGECRVELVKHLSRLKSVIHYCNDR